MEPSIGALCTAMTQDGMVCGFFNGMTDSGMYLLTGLSSFIGTRGAGTPYAGITVEPRFSDIEKARSEEREKIIRNICDKHKTERYIPKALDYLDPSDIDDRIAACEKFNRLVNALRMKGITHD